MDDGCNMMLSQILDTVETEIKMENSLGQLEYIKHYKNY